MCKIFIFFLFAWQDYFSTHEWEEFPHIRTICLFCFGKLGETFNPCLFWSEKAAYKPLGEWKSCLTRAKKYTLEIINALTLTLTFLFLLRTPTISTR